MDGVGCLELDTELAAKEEQLLQRQLQLVQQKVRECEEIYRGDLQVHQQDSTSLRFLLFIFLSKLSVTIVG